MTVTAEEVLDVILRRNAHLPRSPETGRILVKE
jgi:hypothetical protein